MSPDVPSKVQVPSVSQIGWGQFNGPSVPRMTRELLTGTCILHWFVSVGHYVTVIDTRSASDLFLKYTLHARSDSNNEYFLSVV